MCIHVYTYTQNYITCKYICRKSTRCFFKLRMPMGSFEAQKRFTNDSAVGCFSCWTAHKWRHCSPKMEGPELLFWVCSNMYKYVGYLNIIKHDGFTGRKWWVHFPTKRPGRGALIPTFSALPEAMNSANSCDDLHRCGGVPMNRTMKRRNML